MAVRNMTNAELQKAVRSAAKRANQRLLRMERAVQSGEWSHYGFAYQEAGKYLSAEGRSRFRESVKTASRAELIKEYEAVQGYLLHKDSTVKGRKQIDKKRYRTYVEQGYTGTFDQFKTDVERAFAQKGRFGYGSSSIHTMITSGTRDDLLDTINTLENEMEMQKTTPGKLLIKVLLKGRK